MEAILSRLRALTADQLREEIIGADLKCGPITATTRSIFERKLARALLGRDSGTCQAEGGASLGLGSGGGTSNGKQVEAEATPTRLTQEPKNPRKVEADFGYALGLNPPEEDALMQEVKVEGVSPKAEAQTLSKAQEASPPLYYGVCPLWDDMLAKSDRVHVYLDKKEALQAVKMMKGARFKPFTNREDAEKFSKGICDYCPSPSKPLPCISPGKQGLMFNRDGPSTLEVETINRERANSFKSPRTQDLTAKLRKAVEKGDEAAFCELVWSNPRYLIGSGDNPTIVQEGCRYNVMHVAAKENQAGISQLILDTLENPEFMRLMYPDDQEQMLQKRIHYIVDLYLNTPDKAAFETPLHFACKFGCPEVVNVLCSHPSIDKNSRNKYNQKPADVICERKNKTQEIKQKINGYIEDRIYIPLLRAVDNSYQPVIGAPWSPDPLEGSPHAHLPKLAGSPKDPVMAVRAFAGPLSPSKAEEFRRVWKTPPRERAQHLHHILKSDPDRGAERVGRDLAHELGHPWAEYWEFLGTFMDLSSTEGLRKLEDYLSKKGFSERIVVEAGENEASCRFKTPSPGKPKKFCNSISVGAFLDEGDDISLEEMKNRQNAALTSILPVSHGTDLIETAAEQDCLRATTKNGLCSPCDGTRNGERPGRTVGAALLSPISNLMVEFEKMSLQDMGDSQQGERRRKSSGSGMARQSFSEGGGALNPREVGGWRVCEVDRAAERHSSSSSDEYYLAVESFDGSDHRTGMSALERSRSKSWDHGGWDLCSSGSSSSSYKSLDHSQRDLILRIPPSVKKGLFMEGDSPTKLDREVLSAIEAIEIDPQKYPSIHKWKSTVQAFSTAEMQSWPSPMPSKTRPRQQVHTPGSPSRFSPARFTFSPDFTSPSRYSLATTSYIHRVRQRHFQDPPL